VNRSGEKHEEKNHPPYPLRHALCVLRFRRGAAAEEGPGDRIPLGAASFSFNEALTEAFRQGLRELGYVEGNNIVIEWRSADGKLDGLPALATELVLLKVDLIVTAGPATTRATKEATSTIPIVMAQDSDPVPTGLSPAWRDLEETLLDCQPSPRR
jgi:hypothetical protein